MDFFVSLSKSWPADEHLKSITALLKKFNIKPAEITQQAYIKYIKGLLDFSDDMSLFDIEMNDVNCTQLNDDIKQNIFIFLIENSHQIKQVYHSLQATPNIRLISLPA